MKGKLSNPGTSTGFSHEFNFHASSHAVWPCAAFLILEWNSSLEFQSLIYNPIRKGSLKHSMTKYNAHLFKENAKVRKKHTRSESKTFHSQDWHCKQHHPVNCNLKDGRLACCDRGGCGFASANVFWQEKWVSLFPPSAGTAYALEQPTLSLHGAVDLWLISAGSGRTGSSDWALSTMMLDADCRNMAPFMASCSGQLCHCFIYDICQEDHNNTNCLINTH